MSGTALTTVSPSSVRIRRSVVWVAGCCGPKFSVQRYSLSTPSGGPITSLSVRGMRRAPGEPRGAGGSPAPRSTLGPRDKGEVVALALAAQRVVLAQRVVHEG